MMDFIRWLLCNLGFKFVFPNSCKKKLSAGELAAQTNEVIRDALTFGGGGKARRKTQRKKRRRTSNTRRQ
jgi:hypothetical protein